jgi:hypothetical protein
MTFRRVAQIVGLGCVYALGLLTMGEGDLLGSLTIISPCDSTGHGRQRSRRGNPGG